MKRMLANEIRDSWIKFFESKQHYFMEPASLIPINDPSLLWINSGVATLKNYFSGKENPPAKRLVNSQKALRTNDFFNVGVTSRHQTLFEMLGNFSIGDYFKTEAVHFAYELLTKVWEIDVNKLWFTIFKDDEETYKLWTDLGINPHRILKCDRDRNFWDVGNGPCGPCTEIHYDRGEKYDPQGLGEKLILEDIENDRYIEIWNIVFSQFNNDGNDNYTELLRKNIDTGAGLERIASISQDVPTNFDTDLFQTIIKETEKFSNLKYDMNAYFSQDPNQIRINFCYKVIADHFRAAVLAIADGAIPDNKDRGYVLRRLIRRATVYANNLEITDKKWVDATIAGVVQSLQPFYSYLLDKQADVARVIHKEIDLFNITLKQGIKLFNDAISKNALNDDLVFNLATTYGFPIEIIKEMASANKIAINEDEFKKRFAEHQKISNANNTNKAMDNQNNSLINLKVASKFIYDTFEKSAKVVTLFDENFNEVETLNGNGWVVFDETIFYATSGGQIHDTGFINDKYFVDNVIKAPNLQHIHHVINANLKLNEVVELKINKADRTKNMAHHSSEHLLQAALVKFISNNIKQQGAFKSPQKVTFDFQHPDKLTDEQLEQVENWINDIIKQEIPVEILSMTLDEAKEAHAAAYFEDVYKKIGGLLRVIKIGDKSLELCGGTHVHNTKDIEQFSITNYTSKGSGQWRIEAIATWDNFENYKNEFLTNSDEYFKNIKDHFINKNVATTELDELYNTYKAKLSKAKVRNYINIFNELKNNINDLKTKLFNDINKKEILNIKKIFNDVSENKKYVVFDEQFDIANITKAVIELINETKNIIYAAIIKQDNRIQYIFATDKDTTIDLNDVIKKVNEISNGKGFGRNNFVRGGSPEGDKLSAITDYLDSIGYKHA